MKMSSIFDYLDYREFLSFELKVRKQSQMGFSQAKLAANAGIRNTYLTNVLKGRGNFNSDQIASIARHLNLSKDESDYLMLLKEFDQSIDADRKKNLLSEINKRRDSARATESYITAKVRRDEHELIMKYYSDPAIKLTHVLLKIPRYAARPKQIATDLRLSQKHLETIFAVLEELEIVRFGKEGVEVLQSNFHLPKDSPMLMAHQGLMRTRSAYRMQETTPEKRYSFSVTFTGTEKTRAEIQAKFLDFLKDIEGTVKGAPSEEAYQINFDLFPWTDSAEN